MQGPQSVSSDSSDMINAAALADMYVAAPGRYDPLAATPDYKVDCLFG